MKEVPRSPRFDYYVKVLCKSSIRGKEEGRSLRTCLSLGRCQVTRIEVRFWLAEPFIGQKATALWSRWIRRIELAGVAKSRLLAYECAVRQELDAVLLTDMVHPMEWSSINDGKLLLTMDINQVRD